MWWKSRMRGKNRIREASAFVPSVLPAIFLPKMESRPQKHRSDGTGMKKRRMRVNRVKERKSTVT